MYNMKNQSSWKNLHKSRSLLWFHQLLNMNVTAVDSIDNIVANSLENVKNFLWSIVRFILECSWIWYRQNFFKGILDGNWLSIFGYNHFLLFGHISDENWFWMCSSNIQQKKIMVMLHQIQWFVSLLSEHKK